MSQIHQSIIQLAIAYTLLGVFIFTVVITCLSLVGIVKFYDNSQQNKLFYILVIETMIISVAFFGNFLNFNTESLAEKAVKNTVNSSKEKGTVYIQIPSSSVEKEAEKLQSFLIGRGYVAPGIEIVGSEKSPTTPQIRYFYEAQENRAERLRQEITDFGISNFQTKNVKGYEGKANPEVLEIWYRK